MKNIDGHFQLPINYTNTVMRVSNREECRTLPVDGVRSIRGCRKVFQLKSASNVKASLMHSEDAVCNALGQPHIDCSFSSSTAPMILFL